MPIERLYPAVEFPVSRGTPMISPLIKWDHSEDWYVMKYVGEGHTGERRVTISLDEESYISGHIIDGLCCANMICIVYLFHFNCYHSLHFQFASINLGRTIVPATTYLQLVWESQLIMTKGAIVASVNVEFEDVKFLRATTMTVGQEIDLTIMIHYGSGQFEITENGVAVVSGIIREVEASESTDEPITIEDFDDKCCVLEKNDFYKELRLRGYHYQHIFQGIERARADGAQAIIKWNDNWPAFIDNMLQVSHFI